MESQLTRLFILSVVIFCFSSPSLSRAKTLEEKLDDETALDKLCGDIHLLRQLSQMQELIDSVKTVMKEKSYLDYKKLTATGWDNYLKLALHPSRQCLIQADAILDLEPIIAERDNVCQASHIDKIEAYRNRHLKNKKVDPEYREDVKPITEEFFSIYLGQVAYTCKQNLLPSLLESDKRIGGQEKYSKVLPWLRDIEGCTLEDAVLDVAGDGGNVFGLNGYGKTSSNERDRRCGAIEALSSIKRLKELVEALADSEQQSNQVDKIVKLDADISNAAGGNSKIETENALNNEDVSFNKDEFILVVPENKYEAVEDVMQACSIFEQVYTNTIMPIVRLHLMGFDPKSERFNKGFDQLCLKEELIQRWFSITLICKSMLTTRLASQTDPGKEAKAGLIVVDDTSDKSSDKFKDKRGDHVELPTYLSYPIDDDLWAGKHELSRLGGMKTKFITKVVKTFKINKLVNSVVWRKSFTEQKRVSISLVLVILTLVGLDGTFFLRK